MAFIIVNTALKYWITKIELLNLFFGDNLQTIPLSYTTLIPGIQN